MSPKYAKDLPPGHANYLKKIAIVGAGGHVGKPIAEALLQTGKHQLTAISRADSTGPVPDGMQVAKIDYDDQASLVRALQGHDAVIITLAAMAPPDRQAKLIAAAAEAKVPWVMPNGYGINASNEALGRDTMIYDAAVAIRRQIEDLGTSAWVNLSCGFWYEWSMACGPYAYGFDLARRTVTFYDDGNTRINTSTWNLCGLAVARLFSLKVLPDDEADRSACLSQYRNSEVYISSFLANQRDMLASVQRVTGTTDQDWTIQHEDVRERYQAGMQEFRAGNRLGFGKLLYARVFFPGEEGNFSAIHKLQNGVLGLPEENIDDATKRALDMVEAGWQPFP